jgi:superfamily II DNA helicase RecQ
MFQDNNAMFRSTDQHTVLSSLLERKTHVLHVCKTGGGKTLAFQMAMKMWPSTVKGVIVVPYVVLYEEMKARMESIGLPTQICSEEIMMDPQARVFVVGLDTFASPVFYSQVKQIAESGQLGAVLLDEVDAVVTDGDFRPQFSEAYEHALRLPNTILLFLSATIPAPFEGEWFDTLCLRSVSVPGSLGMATNANARTPHLTSEEHPSFRIIRNRSTDRLNIHYAVEAYGVDRNATIFKKKVSEIVRLSSHTIVYVIKHDTVHDLGQYLSTPWKIHGNTSPSNRMNVIESFRKQEKSVLVGNKAAYYGIDVQNVDAVIIAIEVRRVSSRLNRHSGFVC